MGKFTLIMMIGIPGSGKSTWAKNILLTPQYTKGRVFHYISTDDIRIDLFGTVEFNPKQKMQVYEEAFSRIDKLKQAAQKDPRDIETVVILDSTNTDKRLWEMYLWDLQPNTMIAKVFMIPPEIAIKRIEETRTDVNRRIPLDILQMKWKELIENLKDLPSYFDFVYFTNIKNHGAALFEETSTTTNDLELLNH